MIKEWNKEDLCLIKKIGNTLYLGKDIERWGSGIKRISDECKENNVKVEFRVEPNGLTVIFYRPNVGLKDTVNVGVKIEKDILDLIINNPKITQPKIAKELNITTRTIERNIQRLKEKNMLERIGSDKTGYWKVINKK